MQRSDMVEAEALAEALAGLSPVQRAVGRCPVCGRWPTWFNDIPMRAFCWGPDCQPHPEMTAIVRKGPGHWKKIGQSR